MNKEYEYSFKVRDLKPYIDYCKNNNYELLEENKQVRTLYKKKDKTMARITSKEKNGITKLFLDFKEDVISDEDLIERKESLAVEFNDEKAVFSILDFLEYKKDIELSRIRMVYKKDNVIFEIDSYNSPEIMYVVAVEGDKEEVDKVYKEIKDKL